MTTEPLDDELWRLIEPLLPRVQRRSRHPGRSESTIDEREWIMFVLSTGIACSGSLKELGFGSGMTCWRRLRDWQQAGVWQRLHELLLARLRQADQLDLSRAVCDSASLRALLGAARPPAPTAMTSPRPLPLIEAIPIVRGKRGRPRHRPDVLLADRGYDSQLHRKALRAQGIRPIIAKRETEHGSGLGRERRVVERTLSWLHQYRPTHPYETPRRYPRSLPQPRLQPHLLQPPQQLTLSDT